MDNNFTCIIIDDEQDAIELLKTILTDLYANIHIAGTYTSWKNAFTFLQNNNFDLLFLDISMPGQSGFDFLRIVPGLTSEVIFTTAYAEYAVEAFMFSASGYLLKPIGDTKLVAAVDKALEKIRQKKQVKEADAKMLSSTKLGIYNNKGIDYIDLHNILYLEAFRNYTKIVTNETTFLSSNNIGNFKYLTETHKFYQVHRSYIVNLSHVTRYEFNGLLVMSDKKEVPVSKNVKDGFIKSLGNFY